MQPSITCTFTITLNDSQLNDFQIEQRTQQLYKRLAQVSGLIDMQRVPNNQATAGLKGGRYLVGKLRLKARQSAVPEIAQTVYDAVKASGCASLSIDDHPDSVASSHNSSEGFTTQVVDFLAPAQGE
jgi:hypothetical protein